MARSVKGIYLVGDVQLFITLVFADVNIKMVYQGASEIDVSSVSLKNLILLRIISTIAMLSKRSNLILSGS
ncbi:hypothetical protein BC941DRAFT_468025 [Chlamydoabsidia padenii]|nr:hypothetical protein BC941DRAFT_468025 [Chlamydoabsidia padenii]